MYDFAIPNSKPGVCDKCKGSGLYRWGGTVNGKSRFEGRCHSCQGSGVQNTSDMARNRAYNRHKIRNLPI